MLCDRDFGNQMDFTAKCDEQHEILKHNGWQKNEKVARNKSYGLILCDSDIGTYFFFQ